MRRCGLTLIETLLAVSLLSGLAIAAVGWTTSVVRLSVTTQERANWTGGVSAVYRLINDDIANGDLDRKEMDREGRPSWISLERDQIRMRSRSAPYHGSEKVIYTLDRESGTLIRRVEWEREPLQSRVAIGSVSTFETILVEPSGPEQSWMLKVVIGSDQFGSRTHEFDLRSRGEP